jgi:hypothetical protein
MNIPENFKPGEWIWDSESQSFVKLAMLNSDQLSDLSDERPLSESTAVDEGGDDPGNLGDTNGR